MSWLWIALGVWLVVAFGVSVLIGRAIRRSDRAELGSTLDWNISGLDVDAPNQPGLDVDAPNQRDSRQ